MMKNIYIFFVLQLFSCARPNSAPSHVTSDSPSSSLPTPTSVVTTSAVQAADIELICTPGSIPLNLIEEGDDTLLYLRRKLVSKVFSTPSGQDAIFKLELPFLNSASKKKVFFINQSNKAFCNTKAGPDVIGEIAKKEDFIKAVKKQILWVEFHQK